MPEPYYDEGGVAIYHGDCREVLPTVRADLVVTDPPYNVGLRYGDGTDDARGDYIAWCGEWFGQLQGAADTIALTPGIANLMTWAQIAPTPDWVLAWHKPAAMGRCHLGFNNWEPVLYWGRRRNHVDVVRATIKPDPALKGHPCPKPLAWATGLIERLSDDGATVLDPFMGSGTTLVAAQGLGRRAIGIEIEERYCEIAANRCQRQRQQAA